MKKLLLILFFAFLRFSAVPLFFLAGCLLPFALQSQWVKQTIPVNKPISGIKFIDSLKGWACTNWTPTFDSSYILNTTNGGLNWNIQFRGAVSLQAIAMIDANTGYCGGGNGGGGKLYKTTNGGLNWNDIGSPSRITDMVFLNADSGWISSEIFAADVLTTTDGGATWQLRNSGLTDNINRLFFLNYSTGWAGSRYLKKTTNAGMNWVQIYDFATESIYSMYFINEQTGWAALSGAKIGKTTNGGLNWIIQKPSVTSDNTTDIYMVNDTGWAGTGLFYKVFKTVNGGLNWGQQSDTSGSIRISVINSNLAWSGSIGISKTTNGGGPIFYLGFTPEGTNIPKNFTLYQNYPNPFNPYTNIKLDVSESSVIKLYISDILGRVHYEVINQYLVPGKYEFNWDSRGYSSGVYYYTLISDKFTETKKMLLIK
jgi:photosystem II stability/assembly factor-like uncharacterized protein